MISFFREKKTKLKTAISSPCRCPKIAARNPPSEQKRVRHLQAVVTGQDPNLIAPYLSVFLFHHISAFCFHSYKANIPTCSPTFLTQSHLRTISKCHSHPTNSIRPSIAKLNYFAIKHNSPPYGICPPFNMQHAEHIQQLPPSPKRFF